MVLDRGTAQFEKIVRQSVRDGSSENPFLEVGMPPVIFRLNDAELKAQVRSRIEANFRRFERDRRGRLREVRFQKDTGENEVVADIYFTDLELNRPESISVVLGA